MHPPFLNTNHTRSIPLLSVFERWGALNSRVMGLLQPDLGGSICLFAHEQSKKIKAKAKYTRACIVS